MDKFSRKIEKFSRQHKGLTPIVNFSYAIEPVVSSLLTTASLVAMAYFFTCLQLFSLEDYIGQVLLSILKILLCAHFAVTILAASTMGAIFCPLFIIGLSSLAIWFGWSLEAQYSGQTLHVIGEGTLKYSMFVGVLCLAICQLNKRFIIKKPQKSSGK